MLRVGSTWVILHKVFSSTDPTDPGWVSVSNFQNGWGNYSGWPVVAYRRMNGITFLRGLAAGGPGGANVIFTLPAGYRPVGRIIFACETNLGVARVDVEPNGIVSSQSGSYSDHISLNGVTFPADV
jgi:hypothetical protein